MFRTSIYNLAVSVCKGKGVGLQSGIKSNLSPDFTITNHRMYYEIACTCLMTKLLICICYFSILFYITISDQRVIVLQDLSLYLDGEFVTFV